MNVVYAMQSAPSKFARSIFLAGPTPREDGVASWRPEALAILADLGFEDVVFVPETSDGTWRQSYDDQVEWEEAALNMSDVIVFWVPRDLTVSSSGELTMPAFTTNVEWGRWESSGKVVFGAPQKSPKNTYLRYYATKLGVPIGETLQATLDEAIRMTGNGDLRSGGERDVPLYIWRTEHFQSWYRAQREAGNRLDGARVKWISRAGKDHQLFYWALHVNIYVAAEKRNKSNEVVVARPDTSAVLLYRRSDDLMSTSVVLVREFRSPSVAKDGEVHELPGGSSQNADINFLENARKELNEETGLLLDAPRFQVHPARQLAATLSAHKTHLFSVEITSKELDWLKAEQGKVHGNIEDTEHTYIEVVTVGELLASTNPDWTTIGMILSVLAR